ncbi:MAG TPA: ribonuclease P protein component [Edaphocola sp.]|nr:ribonuclease P protein component [Edaphocola sp.]
MTKDSKVDYTFTASERLKHRKLIETLFQNGKAFSVFPFKVVYSIVDKSNTENTFVRMGCVVPKRNKKRAVDRNLIKRKLKEAWRLQKHILIPDIPEHKELHVFFIYIGKEIPNFSIIAASVSKIIIKLQSITTKVSL